MPRGAEAVDGQSHISPRAHLIGYLRGVAREAAASMQHDNRRIRCGAVGIAAEQRRQASVRPRQIPQQFDYATARARKPAVDPRAGIWRSRRSQPARTPCALRGSSRPKARTNARDVVQAARTASHREPHLIPFRKMDLHLTICGCPGCARSRRASRPAHLAGLGLPCRR
jgi:hypothetical protein